MMQTAAESPAFETASPIRSTNASRPRTQLTGIQLLPSRRARRIAPEQGRAIEKLAHAIEYLTDELTLQCMTARSESFQPQPTLAAIELLKRCNREIYLACPPIPTFTERMRHWFGRTPASVSH